MECGRCVRVPVFGLSCGQCFYEATIQYAGIPACEYFLLVHKPEQGAHTLVLLNE